MANLKDIKRRIGSVKNTQQITKAMKLVAAAKLRRAQEAVEFARPYSEKMMELMEGLSARSNPESHPMLSKREEKSVLILVFTGDKGLCGPFNSSMLKATQTLVDKNRGKKISLFVVGKRGLAFFGGRPVGITGSVTNIGNEDAYQVAERIAGALTKAFIEATADVVYMVYNKFKNVVVQEPQVVSLLPVKIEGAEPGKEGSDTIVDYEYEPSAEEILDGILKRYIISQVHRAELESAASEHGARMTAMDAATRNAKEMIDNLTLQYNRARQSAITTELIEVVTGADALKG